MTCEGTIKNWLQAKSMGSEIEWVFFSQKRAALPTRLWAGFGPSLSMWTVNCYKWYKFCFRLAIYKTHISAHIALIPFTIQYLFSLIVKLIHKIEETLFFHFIVSTSNNSDLINITYVCRLRVNTWFLLVWRINYYQF